MADTPITAVMNVAVPTDDQDRARAFWVDVLGCEERMDTELAEGFRWIEVAPPGAPTAIALVAASEGNPVGGDTGIRLRTPDAAALHATLEGQGLEVGELLLWDTAPPMFHFRDHDGNGLYVVQDD